MDDERVFLTTFTGKSIFIYINLNVKQKLARLDMDPARGSESPCLEQLSRLLPYLYVSVRSERSHSIRNHQSGIPERFGAEWPPNRTSEHG